MPDPRIGALLRRATRPGSRAEPTVTDALLLDRLARGASPSDREAAFAELVSRHGPAVWALCRRLTRTEPDAEDVFQATFLVLARDPKRVRKAASVGSWLYGVASRIGRKARAKGDRTPDPDRLRSPTSPPDPTADLSWNEVRTALDEELARLPDVLRAPILLCYFEGTTQDEAATALGWSARTVKSRVARARDLLRARLTRRGIELPAVLAVPLLSAGASTAVPLRLVTSLTAALARGRSIGPEVSPAVVALARTECPAMSLRSVLLVLTAAGLLAAGALAGRSTSAGASSESPTEQPAADPPLAPGAVRIGTKHFRQTSGWHRKVFFTTDGKTLVAPETGKTVELWDVDTGRRSHSIPIPQSGFEDSDFHARGNLLALFGRRWADESGGETTLNIWLVDVATRQLVRTIPVRDDEGRSNYHRVRFTPDGKRLITGAADLRVWDVKSGEELIREKTRGSGGMGAFDLSPDGKTVAFGQYGLHLWQWESGEEPKKLAGFGDNRTELVGFGPDSKTLFVDGGIGVVTTFDITTGRQTGTRDFGKRLWKWSLSPDGKSLAVVYYDSSKATGPAQAVVVWDPETGKEQARFPIGRSKATNVSWSPDGSRLAATTDYRLWVWDVKTRDPLGPGATGHEGSITDFAFGPDNRLYTSSDDHTIRSWDAATGKPGLELIHDYWVRALALSPDGSLVVGSALGNDLRIWDTKTGKERFKLLGNGSHGGKRVVRFTPDGKRLIAWGDDQFLRVFDTRTGKLLAEHTTREGGATPDEWEDPFGSARLEMMMLSGADISADGSTFAIGSYNRSVRVIDVETGKERMTFDGHENGNLAVALSPDGKRIAIGGRGKSIETRLPNGRTRSTSANEHPVAVWDLATKKVIWETTSPGSWALGRDLRFSPDGSQLAQVVSDDEKQSFVRFWEATTGKELGRVELPARGGHFGFDRTGKRIAVSFQDTTAMVFDLATALKK